MRVYVWTLPTRVFHWMLVLFVLLAFVTAEFESFLNIHAALGYGIGLLVLFRILWGFVGPRYSRFSDWPLSLREAGAFGQKILHMHKAYVGHNPAASWVMLGIIVVLFLLTATGILAYGIQEGRGPLSFMNAGFFKEMELFESLHEGLSTILMLLVGAHVAGVVVDRILHPEVETLGSILHGYKSLDATSVTLSLFQKSLAAVMLAIALCVTLYALSSDSILTQSRYSAVDYAKEHPLFASECAACHTRYPPTLLPKKSWRRLMSDLEHHFGDDASLEPEEEQSILAYLLNNSAEGSSHESSVKILQSFPNKAIIAITKTPYWRKRHQEIGDAVFQSEKVKSKANCKACHSDVEKGMIEDVNIQIPAQGS